jgi:uncharacterized protein YndB with AHSA1/START domain
MHSITHLARFHVPPERVYRAIGATDYLRQWWMQEARVGAEAERTARLEVICRSVDARVRFDDRRPPASVRWKTIPVSSPIPGWGTTTIKLDLRPAEGGTVLALTHSGFEQADEDYGRTAAGWARCLLALQRHLEAGTETTETLRRINTFPAVGNPSRPLILTAER